MPHPLSRARHDWSALVEAARQWPALSPLGEHARDDDLNLLMEAPVAVAWWLSAFAPELLERDRLDLLIVGVAGGPGAVDGGRPYQLLPFLLERPRLAISVTFIIGTPDAPLAPVVAHAVPATSLDGQAGIGAKPATMFEGTLAEWWHSRRGVPPDLCLLLHPAFDVRLDFWAGLRLLLQGGVPVGCFARGSEKVERDVWLLEAYGYHVAPDPRPNPWARRRPESGGHGAWTAIGWELRPRSIPPADYPIDQQRLARARAAQRLLEYEFEVWNPLQFIGQVQADTESASASARLVGLPDHHVVSLATGQVWALEPDGRVPAEGNTWLPPEVLATYPGEAATRFERLLWAVEVYQNEFRPREAAALDQRSDAQLKRLQDALTESLRGSASVEEIAAFTEYYRGGAAPTRATEGSEALFAALRRRDWEKAAALIAQDAALANAQDEDGRTPLFYAMTAGYHDLARRWLEAGANPNHLDHEGFAVIHDLAKRDDIEPIELLDRYGADLDLGTGLGFTPALLALRYGCWPVLGYLLSRHVDLHKTMLAGASVADHYPQVTGLPRVLRSEIDRQLGKRYVIPIAVMAQRAAARPPG